MSTEEAYAELQHVKYEVIEAMQRQSKELPWLLTKLEYASGKTCFDYEDELQWCKEVAQEETRQKVSWQQ